MGLKIYFLNGNDLATQDQYTQKEYRDDVMIEIDGLFYEVYFFTKDALEYEMTKDGYFSFPGIIILEQVSTEKIFVAIKNLHDKGFFKSLKGSNQLSQEDRFIHEWYLNKLPLYDKKKVISKEVV